MEENSIGIVVPILAVESAILKTIVSGKERDNRWEIGSVQTFRGSYIEVKQGMVAFLVILLGIPN